jgi:hypothetical protein
MNDTEICDEISELLYSYRQLYIEDTEETASAAEYKEYQSRSELAWDTLKASFGHRKEFTPGYL